MTYETSTYLYQTEASPRRHPRNPAGKDAVSPHLHRKLQALLRDNRNTTRPRPGMRNGGTCAGCSVSVSGPCRGRLSSLSGPARPSGPHGIRRAEEVRCIASSYAGNTPSRRCRHPLPGLSLHYPYCGNATAEADKPDPFAASPSRVSWQASYSWHGLVPVQRSEIINSSGNCTQAMLAATQLFRRLGKRSRATPDRSNRSHHRTSTGTKCWVHHDTCQSRQPRALDRCRVSRATAESDYLLDVPLGVPAEVLKTMLQDRPTSSYSLFSLKQMFLQG